VTGDRPIPTAQRAGSSLRVLVIESSDELRERLVRLANDVAGVDAAQADSAESALELLGETSFDVVVLDVEAAGGAGLDALGRLRRCARYSVLIALGSDPEPELSERCFLLGADFFFVTSRQFMHIREVLAVLAQTVHGG
jgi:DNA-binding response OmpR family regulator